MRKVGKVQGLTMRHVARGTAGWDTSISKGSIIFVEYTYLGGVAPRALHGPAKPGQGFQAVGCWTLNNTLNDAVLTSGYAKDLEKACMEVWGWLRRWGRFKVQQS